MKIYSNGKFDGYVRSPFEVQLQVSQTAFLAAPYYTYYEPILEAAEAGAKIDLLIGLNPATNPNAIRKVFGHANVKVRYFTNFFHAKIFVFDETSLLGSSNLTGGGMMKNREAVVYLNTEDHGDEIDEVRALFSELWDAAAILTPSALDDFETLWKANRKPIADAEAAFKAKLGRVEPVNIHVESGKVRTKKSFLNGLRKSVYEQYKPAFAEVTSVLSAEGLQRADMGDIGPYNETNRFLNWVRLTYVHGDEAWKEALMLSPDQRRSKIIELGKEWRITDKSKVTDEYFEWLATAKRVFGDQLDLEKASQQDITDGLMSIHAFTEQLRFTKGGLDNVPKEFWKENKGDVGRVKTTLLHLLYGPGDFIERLHDILYNTKYKLRKFARFSALETFGTIHPDICPPMNSRTAKALCYLGYTVKV